MAGSFFLGRGWELKGKSQITSQETESDYLWLAIDGTSFPWSETGDLLKTETEVAALSLEKQPFNYDFTIIVEEPRSRWEAYSQEYHPYDINFTLNRLEEDAYIEIDQLKKALGINENCEEPYWWQKFYDSCVQFAAQHQDAGCVGDSISPDNLQYLFRQIGNWKR